MTVSASSLTRWLGLYPLSSGNSLIDVCSRLFTHTILRWREWLISWFQPAPIQPQCEPPISEMLCLRLLHREQNTATYCEGWLAEENRAHGIMDTLFGRQRGEQGARIAELLIRTYNLDLGVAICAAARHFNPTALAHLLRFEDAASALRNIRNRQGQLVLHSACGYCGYSDFHEADVPEVMNLLLATAPYQARVRSTKGQLPLHEAAAFSGSRTVIQLLLNEYPEAARVRDFDEQLPLHKASFDMQRIILEAWPDAAMDRGPAYSTLPLHTAVLRKAPIDVIEALVRAGPAAVVVRSHFTRTLPLCCNGQQRKLYMWALNQVKQGATDKWLLYSLRRALFELRLTHQRNATPPCWNPETMGLFTTLRQRAARLGHYYWT